MSMIIIFKTLLMIAILCFSVAYVRLFKLHKCSLRSREVKTKQKEFENCLRWFDMERFERSLTQEWRQSEVKFAVNFVCLCREKQLRLLMSVAQRQWATAMTLQLLFIVGDINASSPLRWIFDRLSSSLRLVAICSRRLLITFDF